MQLINQLINQTSNSSFFVDLVCWFRCLCWHRILVAPGWLWECAGRLQRFWKVYWPLGDPRKFYDTLDTDKYGPFCDIYRERKKTTWRPWLASTCILSLLTDVVNILSKLLRSPWGISETRVTLAMRRYCSPPVSRKLRWRYCVHGSSSRWSN